MIELKQFSLGVVRGPWFDISLEDSGDLSTDEGLQTAIILSLFCHARAQEDDEIPDGADPRGWWGDVLADEDNDRWGSRLWLLFRRKTTQETLRDAKHYVEEALEWLLEDNVAQSIEVDVQRSGTYRMTIDITIQRPEGGLYQAVWEYQLAA